MPNYKVEYLPSGKLSVRVTSPMGRRKRATGRTLEHVYAKIEEIRTVTVRDAWDGYVETLRGRWQKLVRAFAKNHLKPLLDVRPDSLTPARLAAWYRVVRDKVGPKTADNIYQSFAACCKLAGWDPLPWGRWRPARVPREIKREGATSIEELQALLREARKLDAHVTKRGQLGDWTARIGFACLCGLRQSELAALAWDDWNEEHAFVTIRRALKEGGNGKRPEDWPKGNKIRTIKLHANAHGLLAEQRERLQDANLYSPQGPVFPARNGEFRRVPTPIDPETFRRLVIRADLPSPERWTPHSCRHTFLTLDAVGNFQTTGDIRGAMQRAGHSRVETTMGYVHRAGRGLAPAYMPAFLMPGPQYTIEPPETPRPKRLTLNAGAGTQAQVKAKRGKNEAETK